MKVIKCVTIFTICLLSTLTNISSISWSDDSSYELKLKKALHAVNNRNYGNAQDLFNALIKEYPDRPEGYCGLALIEIKYKDYPTARMYASKASTVNPAYPQSYYLLGICEEQLKDYSKAITYYRKYLALEPESANKDKIMMRINFLQETLAP